MFKKKGVTMPETTNVKIVTLKEKKINDLKEKQVAMKKYYDSISIDNKGLTKR